MHAYIHACIHPYIIHACMHTCMHAYIHECMHTYIHACMHAYIHACMHTCMHACIHTCMHAYIHTCMHACMHTDICIYNVPFSVYVAIASLYCCLVPPCLSKDLSLGEAIRCREGVGLPGHMSRWLAALDLDGAAGRHHVEGYDLLGMVILIWWMWVKQFHRPSPSHHHFYRWFKPFPAMGGKHGVVLPTLIWVWFAGYIIWVWLDLALRQVWQLLMEHFWGLNMTFVDGKTSKKHAGSGFPWTHDAHVNFFPRWITLHQNTLGESTLAMGNHQWRFYISGKSSKLYL